MAASASDHFPKSSRSGLELASPEVGDAKGHRGDPYIYQYIDIVAQGFLINLWS